MCVLSAPLSTSLATENSWPTAGSCESRSPPPLNLSHPLGWITLSRSSYNGTWVCWKGMVSFLHVLLRGQFILKWQHLWTQMHSSIPCFGLLHVVDKAESCDRLTAQHWLVQRENSERLYRIVTLAELRLFQHGRLIIGILGNAWLAVLAGSW